jgi:hypothetical protein
MLSLASLAITLVTPERLSALVSGERLWVSTGLAAIIGSVALMPGFIAFPLERVYFATGVSLLRNGLCLAVTMRIALVIGLVFGELG